jgi:hypothetical protein
MHATHQIDDDVLAKRLPPLHGEVNAPRNRLKAVRIHVQHRRAGHLREE